MAAAGSYAGTAFTIAGDGFGYPNPGAQDDDGVLRVRIDAIFASRAARNAVVAKQTSVDWQRTLGVLRATPAIQAGYGPATLVLTTKAGRQVTYTSSAYLEAVEDAKGYGRAERDLWRMTLSFAIDQAAGNV